jgi:5-methylcytosine-specific restriction endonuclease McrA
MPAGKYIRTPEIRAKNSAATSASMTPEHRATISASRKRTPKENALLKSKNFSSKPRIRAPKGATKFLLYKSVLREWSQHIMKRDNWTCQKCGIRGSIELNADHIIPKWGNPALIYTLSNGRTLCRPCHVNSEYFGGKAPKAIYGTQLTLPLIV